MQSLKASSIHDIVDEWYARFVSVEQKELFDLIVAAASLDIQPLLDLANTTVALMMKGKSPEEIRRQFNIRNDLTLEEEEQVRLQNTKKEEEEVEFFFNDFFFFFSHLSNKVDSIIASLILFSSSDYVNYSVSFSLIFILFA